MNPPDSASFPDRSPAPPPVLRSTARQRSLAAALAAVEEPAAVPAVPRLRILRTGRWQLTGLAACWALTGYFRLSAPPGPENPGTAPAAGYAAWPGPWHPAPDEETAQLLATFYPGREGFTPPP